MKYAIVDIGSNSMRLTVYEVGNNNFKILLKQRIIAVLASYVKDGRLTEKGIECAADSLLEFKETIDAFKIKKYFSICNCVFKKYCKYQWSSE